MPHRLIVNGELVLYGAVGRGLLLDDGFTAGEVVEALGEMSGDITVRLNSGGGLARDGIAIFNALKAHDGRVTVKVDAVAASAGSIILMAGDHRIVPPSALVMIHNAAGLTLGTAGEHEKTASILQKLDGQMAGLYAEATDQKVAAIRKLMDEESWFTGEEAVENGFADAAPRDRDDNEPEASAFDYRIYARAPERLRKLAEVCAMNSTKAPEPSGRKPRGLAAQPRSQQENPMTDAEKAAAEKAAADKLAADKAAEAMADAAKADAKLADAVAAERKRAADIHAACSLAGKPDKAASFISDGKSLSEVFASLQADRKPGPEVNTRHNANPVGSGASWDKAVAQQNDRFTAGRSA